MNGVFGENCYVCQSARPRSASVTPTVKSDDCIDAISACICERTAYMAKADEKETMGSGIS